MKHFGAILLVLTILAPIPVAAQSLRGNDLEREIDRELARRIRDGIRGRGYESGAGSASLTLCIPREACLIPRFRGRLHVVTPEGVIIEKER
jgi:hypothetical protein